ncbi:hypothetical protein [Wenzhouxiangella marina]|uniref:Uncharacterized protein n=1 Tax=Wenzhouxiangella marina TaxID=1579979 RepID=A0A0K0Y0B6_9GAMM|nr:hypothetical protein [Wenzhouxiangella marina]AKS43379.1 hypothetical protein WM2015_3027 [Wenzhouxiangella marina]MBB6088505.1 hypothetical protein [Wenzhouxiangella marina]
MARVEYRRGRARRWRAPALAVSLVAVAFSGALLVTGHPWLNAVLWTAPLVPFGTLSTWLGLIGLAAVPVLLFVPANQGWPRLDAALARVSRAAFRAALAWVPVSTLLAGNLSFSFAPGSGFQGGDLASKLFWFYSGALIVLPLTLLVLRWGLRLPFIRRM